MFLNQCGSHLKKFLVDELKTVKMGSPEDFTNFMNAVIDKGCI